MKPLASIFLAWEDLIPHLHSAIKEAAPEIKTCPIIIRARPNGFHIECYEDEASLRRRQLQNDSPEIVAGIIDLR